MIFRMAILGLLGALLLGCSERAETPPVPNQTASASLQTQPPVLLPYQRGGRWGFITPEGSIAIKPVFGRVYRFSEGLAAAMDAQTGHWGFLDSQGSWAIAPRDNYAMVAPGGFKNGRVSVAQLIGNKRVWGLIDMTGQWVIQPSFSQPLLFTHGLARAQTDEGLYGYIGPDGNFVIPATFSLGRRFSEDLAAVLVGGQPGPGRRIIGGKWGLIDVTGKYAVNPEFASIGDYSEGFAAAWFRIDHAGPIAFRGYVDRDGALVIETERFDQGGEFRQGRAKVRDRESGLWGFIDDTGSLVVPASYSSVRDFSEGVAAVLVADVEKDNLWRWGYVGREGDWVITPAFDHAGDFRDGFAPVTRNGETGYIDKQGKWVGVK